MRNLMLLAILTAPAWAAEDLTAPQAVLRALANSPSIQAAAAARASSSG